MKEAMITYRIATTDDAQAIQEIYRYYVEHTFITFDFDVPTVEEFAHRIAHTLQRYPYLVAVKDNQVIGYAYAGIYKDRAAYDWSVEISIYLDNKLQHQGVGSRLYQTLEHYLKEQRVTNIYSCISYPNDASIHFHEKWGFEQIAHFHRCGFKLGKWRDMVWLEKFIALHLDDVKPFIPFQELQE